MKVMLIQLPHFFNGTSRKPDMYPLGIGYIVSVLKTNYEMIPMDLWIDNTRIDRALSLISRHKPDVFCISVYSTQYPYFKELATAIKARYPKSIIIAGGPGATFSYKILLEKIPVDFCVIGEGEITIKELLDNLNAAEYVNGIAYKKNNSIVVTDKREQITNLDSLPWPDRHFFDIERYIANMKKSQYFDRRRATNVIAGRGCPYYCTFCSKTFSKIRLRSIDEIGREIAFIKKELALEAIAFNDELVVINKDRILELCSILRKINIEWECQGRINLVDEEILRAMKDAGCTSIGYGVESYSQSILDRMKKQIKVDRIIPVIQMTKKIGLNPVIQYMYGFPGENDNTIQKTVDFFDKIDCGYDGFITTPIPGTELYKEALRKGFIQDEEKYLFDLESGYIRTKPLVNMTEYTDDEFVIKWQNLKQTINKNLFAKHPRICFRHDKMLFIKLFIFHPKLLLHKLMKVLLERAGFIKKASDSYKQ